jgi:hypothetical protein
MEAAGDGKADQDYEGDRFKFYFHSAENTLDK